MLNASARNVKRHRSRREKVRRNEISRLYRPGPANSFRLVFPKAPFDGGAKALESSKILPPLVASFCLKAEAFRSARFTGIRESAENAEWTLKGKPDRTAPKPPSSQLRKNRAPRV